MPLKVLTNRHQSDTEDGHKVTQESDATSSEHAQHEHNTAATNHVPLTSTNPPRIDARPTVGADVHYVSYGTPGGEYTRECRAAKITRIIPEVRADGRTLVSLVVFSPEGLHFPRAVPYEAGSFTGGTWHWPERV